MILVVDNYDSFVYNLVQYVGEAVAAESVSVPGSPAGGDRTGEAVGVGGVVDADDADVVVRRNDAVDVADVRALDPDGVVVSPGPGTPADAGVSVGVFAETDFPVLGVCLGHQALCAANGAPVAAAPAVVHGKPSTVVHDGRGVFAGLPEQFAVGRYHSLAVDGVDLPDALEASAHTDDGTLMAVRHRDRPHVGVQFHPESILTEPGKRLVRNFCDRCTTT